MLVAYIIQVHTTNALMFTNLYLQLLMNIDSNNKYF